MFEFDMIGYVFIVAVLATVLTMALCYYGYKFFHEDEVVEWMARHGIVEIEEEAEER